MNSLSPQHLGICIPCLSTGICLSLPFSNFFNAMSADKELEISLRDPVPCQWGTIGESSKNPWPSNLMSVTQTAIDSRCDRPSAPDFHFEMTKEAAEKIFLVLKRHGMHLGNTAKAQKSSPLGYGLEFRKPKILRPLFGKHPNWSRMNKILENGSS